jgi:PII-like signaling protein
MVMNGPAKKLTVYIDETDKFHGKPVYEVLLDMLFKKKIMGVSVFRGIAGYGSNGVFHTAKMLELSTSMPVKVEVVESEEMINKILPDVYHVVEKGLVEITDTSVVKCFPKAEEEQGEKGEHMKLEGKAKMLRIIISEDDKWEGEPLYEAIIKRLIMNDIAGATVYKAIAGYGPHRRYHKKKTLSAHGELPILITVMDTEDKINKVIPILDELVGEGIVVLSDVNVIKYTHRDAAGLETMG